MQTSTILANLAEANKRASLAAKRQKEAHRTAAANLLKAAGRVEERREAAIALTVDTLLNTPDRAYDGLKVQWERMGHTVPTFAQWRGWVK